MRGWHLDQRWVQNGLICDTICPVNMWLMPLDVSSQLARPPMQRRSSILPPSTPSLLCKSTRCPALPPPAHRRPDCTKGQDSRPQWTGILQRMPADLNTTDADQRAWFEKKRDENRQRDTWSLVSTLRALYPPSSTFATYVRVVPILDVHFVL
jgi:hypothetical protein